MLFTNMIDRNFTVASYYLVPRLDMNEIQYENKF